MEDTLNVNEWKTFLQNNKLSKKAKIDFQKCFDVDIVYLKESLNELFSNNHNFILSEFKKVELENIPVPKVGRFMVMLDKLDQINLNKYRTYFHETYKFKEYPEKPEPNENMNKDEYKAYNDSIKKWNESVTSVDHWNTKWKSINENLNTHIKIDFYGDLNFVTTNKPYIYFDFLDTDLDKINVFITELKNIPVEQINKFKKIEVIDTKNENPESKYSMNQVRVYFDTVEDLMNIQLVETFVTGVYQKYIIINDNMKKMGGKWDLNPNS